MDSRSIVKNLGIRDCPGFRQPDSKLEKPSREPEPESEHRCPRLVGAALCAREKNGPSVSLTHVKCEGTGHDGDILHLLSSRVLSGNPEPAVPATSTRFPPFPGLSVKSSFSNWDLPSCSGSAAPAHPTMKGRKIPQGRLKCQQRTAQHHSSSANGHVSRDVAGLVCNLA